MVLRPDALKARLLRLEEVTARLAALQQADRSQVASAWAIERGLQLGAEIVFDIGNHLLSAHFGSASVGYEDILAQLVECRVIDGSLHRRLRGLGGFRNILVHDYLRLDVGRVSARLDRAPGDFSAFAGAVRQWLEAAGIG